MKKIKVKILGLSYSQSQIGSYVLILSELKGDLKLPIIIKQNDAQYITLKMEEIKTPRPMTQDLFKSFTDIFNSEVVEVCITHIVEGIFYSKVTITTLTDTHEIVCGVGDAISMALLYKCPIYVSKEVIDIAGIYMNDNGEITNEQNKKNHENREPKDMVSVDSLEKMLQNAIDNEEYEIASQLRDRINQLKSKNIDGKV